MSLTVRGPGMSFAGLRASEEAYARGISRISSGFRITRAADDAAGLAISQRMRSQVNGSAMAMRNVQDGINLLQTAEGGLSGMTSMLQRARELAVQAASTGTMTLDDRAAAAVEIRQLVSEIDRTARSTSFNGLRMLDGSRPGGFVFQVGANAGDVLDVGAYDLTAGALLLTGGTATTSTLSTTTYTTYSDPGFLARYNDNTHRSKEKFAFSLDGGTTNVGITLLLDSYTSESEFVSALNAELAGKQVAVRAELKAAPDGSGNRLLFRAAADTTQVLVTGKGAEAIGITTQAEPGTVAAAAATVSLADLVASGSAAAISLVDDALATLTSARSELGATQNRMEHRLSILATTGENLDAARSRIEDADIAKEWAGVVRAQVLSQAGMAMQAQGNQSGQRVLQLLTSL